ncbi:hypothetical protein CAPTEDRAFT_97936 [Capitella teleta]|uniref:b(0,+)-type amino acid transporter 1 n=1 Tax=Capitella teleta TaxID=283909 RepID=R7V7R6_CAPTE|nr:hypothetical protein CAPTEDRAFT_97936 [Capitella teleta]|eukprot:ELU11785.1 hypothetical protein CAPTEDRAFT_97936 [Capitella teleta]
MRPGHSQSSLGSHRTDRSDRLSHITTAPSDRIRLKENVGWVSGTALIVGTMIGSGIFVSPKGLTEGTGSVGLSLICWTICGIVAMLGALTYAELGTMITKSGGEYSYLHEAFGPLSQKVGSIPAFLFAWIMVLLLRPASVAIIALAFATYVIDPFFEVCEASDAAKKCLAAVLILMLAILNCASVRIAVIVQNVLTVAKLVAIVIIIFGGFVQLGLGHTQYLATGFEGTETNAGSIAIGLYNGMWAFDGWNNLNYVTEEIVDPHKNLPRSIYIAIPLVTILYLLMNISYFSAMSVAEMLATPAVALTWGNRVLGSAAWIIPLSVALSTAGAANGTIFSAGRLNYVAAREGHMLELMSMVHVKKFTPAPSIVFTSLLAIIYIIPGNIGGLIEFFNFAVWIFYGLTAAAFIVMRFTTDYKDAYRPCKIPIFIPVIVVIVSVFLVLAPIINDPRLEFLYVALFILAGVIFYIPFVHFQKQPPFMPILTAFLQLLFESAPPVAEEETNNN